MRARALRPGRRSRARAPRRRLRRAPLLRHPPPAIRRLFSFSIRSRPRSRRRTGPGRRSPRRRRRARARASRGCPGPRRGAHRGSRSRDLAIDLAEAPVEERSHLLDEAEDLLLAVRSVSRAAATRIPPSMRVLRRRARPHQALGAREGRPRASRRGACRPMAELAPALARAAADPRATGDPVPTHRDYHANNLMRAPGGQLAAIDFQDLRLGPPDYDPVSLRFERAAEAVACDATRIRSRSCFREPGKFSERSKDDAHGQAVLSPHREAARRVIRRHTAPEGPFAPLLPSSESERGV